MNDASQGIDSLYKAGSPDMRMKVPGVDSTRLPGIYEAGPHNGSTPFSPDMMAALSGAGPPQHRGGEQAMIEALMASIQNDAKAPEVPVRSKEVADQKVTPLGKAVPEVEKAVAAAVQTPPKKIQQQNGFLMPLVNGLNGVLNRIAEALRPIGNFFLKQPTSGTGTA